IPSAAEKALQDDSPTSKVICPPRPICSLHKREALRNSSLRQCLTPALYASSPFLIPLSTARYGRHVSVRQLTDTRIVRYRVISGIWKRRGEVRKKRAFEKEGEVSSDSSKAKGGRRGSSKKQEKHRERGRSNEKENHGVIDAPSPKSQET
ncbi:hypothetical protein B296_00049392, partial [Ensete ventricosum]